MNLPPEWREVLDSLGTWGILILVILIAAIANSAGRDGEE